MRIAESVRTPTIGSRPTPISPSAEFGSRLRGASSLNLSVKESKAHADERANVLATVPVPVAAPADRSTRSSVVSLPPLTPQRPPVASVVSLSFDMHDNFSVREIELVNELNSFRKSPKHYAEKMGLLMELHEPFVSHRRMTYPELLTFVSDKTEEKSLLERLLDEMGSKERDEVAALHVKWAADDIERAKRSKKTAMAAASKKRGSTVVDEQDTILSERQMMLAEIALRFESQRSQATTTLALVSTELHRASHGAKYVGICLHKISSSPPLPELQYGRGLSLAARDGSEMGPLAMQQAPSLAKRYGSGARYGIAQFVGEESATQTVMEMLLSRDDALFAGRKALLDPRFDTVGCGWRNNSSGNATSTFIFSSLYENLQAISNRSHIPLTQLKHELPNAVRETPGTAVGVHGDFNISIVEPRHHPMKCGNIARVVLRCPEDIQVCGVVSHASDEEPAGPTLGDGRSFSHRIDGSHVELLAVLPFRGDFSITLFASKSSFSSGFARIGKLLIASYAWSPIESAVTLPVPTGDFAKRNSRLVSPMAGTLTPFASHAFEIHIPLSNYLADELSVIESELVAIGNKNEHSGASLEELETAAREAQERYSEAEAQCAKQLQMIDDGIQALAKEAVRKRGKETKTKNVQAELEEQRRLEEQHLLEAKSLLGEATMRVEAYRRSARQILAQQKRLTSEREDLQSAMDRSRPLSVELSVGDRRAKMHAVPGSEGTRYALSLRIPSEGRVCLYVNGLLQLTWGIGAE